MFLKTDVLQLSQRLKDMLQIEAFHGLHCICSFVRMFQLLFYIHLFKEEKKMVFTQGIRCWLPLNTINREEEKEEEEDVFDEQVPLTPPLVDIIRPPKAIARTCWIERNKLHRAFGVSSY